MRTPLIAMPLSNDILATGLTPSFIPASDTSYSQYHSYRNRSIQRFANQQLLFGDIDYGDMYRDGMIHTIDRKSVV